MSRGRVACYDWGMKLLLVLSSFVLALVIACAPSGLDPRGLPRPNPVLAGKAGISLDEMGEGYWVFSRKCMECHESKLPSGELEGQWHPVVKGMSGNAGLSVSEETAILKYLRAAKFH